MNNAELTDIPDCENYRDFGQYYRGTYFGFKDTSVKDGLSVALFLGADGDKGFAVQLFNGTNLRTESWNWDNIKKMGFFGCPLLGNTIVGPTYSYIKAYALRESVKGLNFNRLNFFIPNGSFLTDRYARHAGANFTRLYSKKSYGSIEEMTTAFHILNKKFFSIKEAVQQLETGARLGVPLTSQCGLYITDGGPSIYLSYKDYPGTVGTFEGYKNGQPQLKLGRMYKNLYHTLENIFDGKAVVR